MVQSGERGILMNWNKGFSVVLIMAAIAVAGFAAGCSTSGTPEDVTVDNGADTQVGDDLVSVDAADVAVADTADVQVLDLPGDVPSSDIAEVLNDVAVDSQDVVEADVPVIPDPALRLREGGWLSGDLHMHSTYSDGEDSVATVVRIAEYLTDPDFLAFHPEYAGNPVDFIALTDHRTVNQNSDPDFVSDKVVLIPGEEFGASGHSNLFGVTSFVNHDPDGNGPSTEDFFNGFETAHEQGAVASLNHPCDASIMFPWNINNYDSLEIWNVRFALNSAGITAANIDGWETAKHATASSLFRKAAQYQGIGGNAQTLKLYEANLARGHHIAIVGGSDRHTIFPIGFPSTWVRADTRDATGVLDGIKKRHTFVTRTPVSVTLEMTVTVGETVYQMGDQIPVEAEGVDFDINVRVTRGNGGRLMLIAGRAVASDEELAEADLGLMVLDVSVDSVDFQDSLTIKMKPGDWIYPVVFEPLTADDLKPELAAGIPAITSKFAQYTDGNYAPILEALMPYIDLEVVLAPADCDPSKWDSDMTQCITADQEGMASFFMPDWIDRVLNLVTDAEGKTTEWTMGAAGSAIMFVPNPD
jgi:hypothetical protein